MPTHYKLIYFNGRRRAEMIRLIFAYAGVEYEDFRFDPQEFHRYKAGKFLIQISNIQPVCYTSATIL